MRSSPLVNNVSVAYTGTESNTGNNTATDSTVITQLPDLTIAKSHVGNFQQGQVGATYTLTATNSGSATTTAGQTVTVVDTLPAGLTATAISGTGWTCTSRHADLYAYGRSGLCGKLPGDHGDGDRGEQTRRRRWSTTSR
jgi:uncharacterized repeat protein (TIGR01451 family)